MSIARMRFPAQALEELQKEDPGTQVTVSMIRRLVKTGKVPSVPVSENGRRRLVDYDALVEYLKSTAEAKTANGIRRIDEKARMSSWLIK